MGSLLVTCQRSSAAALRVYKTLQSEELFTIVRPRLRGPVGQVKIDACSDLVIFRPGWQRPCQRFGSQPVQRLRWPSPSLRYLAVQWEGPGSTPLYDLYSVNGLLGMWLQRRAVYVVVQPEHLAAAEKPMAAGGREGPGEPAWRRGRGAKLGGLLEAYHDQDHGVTPTFRAGSREYYEVPAEQVARSGGLEEVVELLETARVMCLPDPDEEDDVGEKVDCRVMTWREI